MKPLGPRFGINRRVLLSTLALLPVLQPWISAAQQTPRDSNRAFSFAVYGDSRSMMYLPYKSDQRDEAIKLMVDIFALVLPEKVAEEVIRRDVKLTYDAATGELVQIVMPFETKSEITTLTVDKGWITEASVEDVKLLPGVRRTMFRLPWWRVGRPRDREGCPEWAGQVHSQHRTIRSAPPACRVAFSPRSGITKCGTILTSKAYCRPFHT